MRELVIGKNESGQRMDKFLRKYLKEASGGFIYKMLRKKNIKLNGRRAEGREMLAEGDRIEVYFSEETLRRFCGGGERVYPVTELDMVYEDEELALINKPAGMLSQKAGPEDVSLVEYFLGYLVAEGKWRPAAPADAAPDTPADIFTPGICNRLDFNTSGLVIAGKSLRALQKMSEIIRERRLEKYYLTIVEGVMREPARICGYLAKDAARNRVRIFDSEGEGRSRIETAYEPVADNGRYTLLRVQLITGKTHQIRSHLSSIGHPLLGDIKYGGRPCPWADSYFLHAGELVFPTLPEPFGAVSGKHFYASPPEKFTAARERLFG